jgi:hypothetical protein
MQRDSQTIPQCAFWLGFAGLIPFVATAIVNFIPGAPLHDLALQALLSYGAVIVSFLGGVRWGLAIATSDFANLFGPLFISVVPALLGWFALLLPSSLGLTVLALSFSAMLVADRQLLSAPRWYRSLRLPLSVGAIIALLLGLFS